MPGVGFWDTAEFQTVPPILGTAHPTGYPTYVLLGWLASIVLTPFGEAAFRMNLLVGDPRRGRRRASRSTSSGCLTRSTVLGVAAGLGLAATPIVWAIGDPRRPARAPPRVRRRAPVAARALGAGAPDADPTRADRWLVAAAVVTGLSVGNHSLTLLLALPIALYVLAVEPRIVLRWRMVLAVRRGALIVPAVLVYLELPLRGGAIPVLEAPLVYGTPGHVGRVPVRRRSASSSGAASTTRSGSCRRKLADLARPGDARARPAARSSSRSGSS